MDLLATHAKEIALRIAALPSDRLRNDPQLLDAIEKFALRLLDEVSAVRESRKRVIGETSGIWRAMQPVERR